MASAAPGPFGSIKTENSPEPELVVTSVEPAPVPSNAPAPIDTKDPEGFLKRCSGMNKKTKLRCSAVIGKKSQQNTHPIFLPTCSAHRDQQCFAGWCQFRKADEERCGKLFRWTPPYFELCNDHQGHPDIPCYFLKLPLELRHEVFRYLLPTKPIGSSTAALHDGQGDEFDNPHGLPGMLTGRSCFSSVSCARMPPPPPPGSDRAFSGSVFPIPLLDLFLVNRQTYQEAKDLLFSIAAFTIDVRKDGTFMCGRRLLEPRRPDGSSHFVADEADEAKEKFLKAFDWASVKNYTVDILLENWSSPHPHLPTNATWDEEVEIYDIRDYVSVVVTGILAKSRNLCKLQVRLCLADFEWSEDQVLANTKLIVGPFERLRNVRQPHLTGVFFGRPHHNSMLSVQRAQRQMMKGPLTPPPICSVPSLPTHAPVLIPGMPAFDAYTANWGRWISSSSSASVTKKPMIRQMFTEFKAFYSDLSFIVFDVKHRNGRHAFLHRARVAREQEDVESFRHIRNELIEYWYAYLEKEERLKSQMNARLSHMLDADIYPPNEWEDHGYPARRNSSAVQGSAQSPVLLNADTMAKEGIPMTGNPRHTEISLGAYGSIFQGHAAMNRQSQASHVQINSNSPQVQAQLKQRLFYEKMIMQQRRAQVQASTRDQMQTNAQAQEQTQTQPQALDRSQQSRRHDIEAVGQADISHLFLSQPPRMSNSNIYAESTSDAFAQHTNDYVPISNTPESRGEPGPSCKRRRLDSGYGEVEHSLSEEQMFFGKIMGQELGGDEAAYVGKGKGKMNQHEVICLD